ncbi:MAG: ABC transporter permease [Dehalococcoidia bacterium]|nr:ABC transporter permease [Dehalococcoidia bacterium]
MLAYLIRRLLFAPIILLFVTFFTFVLGHYGPGDPVVILMGQQNNPEVVERIRKERGLDRPLLPTLENWSVFPPALSVQPGQYVDYIWKVLQGDLGESSTLFRGQQVSKLLFQKIAVSAQLGLLSLLIGVSLGMILGLAAAQNQGKWIDPAIVTSALFLSSLPIFVLQPFLVLVFVRWLHILPTSGWGGILDPRIIMPAIVMSLGPIGIITRLMRSSTLEVITQDYVRTARSKGLPELAVRIHHIGRNSILPIFTVVGLSLATLVGGSFVTETLFGIPGVGRLAVDSFFARDYPIIMAFVLITAVAYFIANLIVDIGYSYLDPRIRLN